MKVNLLWLCLFTVIHAIKPGDKLYTKAQGKLHAISETFTRPKLYNLDNIEGNLYIPQYNNNTKDYHVEQSISPPEELTEVVSLLEQAISLNHTSAMITLADLYIFGNYSMPTNYTRAKQLYHKAAKLSSNGHAYFMLGFIYSTGLFGEFEIDQHRANLYYQFGLENGDMNSLLVMASRLHRGIEVPPNCELSLNYYVRLASIGMEWLERKQGERDIDYNIRISDFNGGLYGEKMSETLSTIQIQSRVYSSLRSELEDYNINANDQEIVSLYFRGLEQLKGDYFTPKNYSAAFEIFSQCVELGNDLYASKNYSNVKFLDQVCLSSCQARLGRLYLYGKGVRKDIAVAKSFYDLSLKVKKNGEALEDLGTIEEQGLLGPANFTRAVKYYIDAIKHKSIESNRHLSLLLLKMSGGNPHHVEYRKDIYSRMKEAAHSWDTEALFHFANFLQSGLSKYFQSDPEVSCPNTIIYYSIFVERLSSFYTPHLNYAFQELISGNFKNALIGYSIAAEQGFEPAQISTAYLLYQLQPLNSRKQKTFNEDRVNLAIRYLERASKQGNDDATVLLGDIFSGSYTKLPETILDHERAFKYYRIASDRHSSHGAYKLGEMYEYGIGPNINNSVDYFMAKRYYDSSLRFKYQYDKQNFGKEGAGSGYSKLHISLALLRLRIKYMFNKSAFKDEEIDGGWLSAFRKVKQRESRLEETGQTDKDNLNNVEPMEGYDIGDYLVIALTCMFFIIFFVQNIIRSIRRMRNNRQGNEDEEDDINQPRNGWNGNQWNFRRGNFEIHFFAF